MRFTKDPVPGGSPFWAKPQLERRMFFRHLASAVGGYALLPGRPMETVARAAATTKSTAKYCIFVMLQGAPSHTDTFDLKPDNGMPVADFKPERFNGVLFPQGLMPKLADQLDSIALVRSVRAWANVHGLMQTWVQIGRNPATPTARISPHIGSVVSLELARKDGVLPAFLALNGNPRASAGFLPVVNAPFLVNAGGALPNTAHPSGRERFSSRLDMLRDAEKAGYPGEQLGDLPDEMAGWKLRSQLLMYNSDVDRIFDLPAAESARYGNSPFGNACLTARNLLRANLGTRFIQITYGSWDHHANIYTQLPPMAAILDSGLGTLLADLKADGLLNQTLVVTQGEFGRTVGRLNGNRGRDHFSQQTVMFAGAGIKGGRAIGSTDDLGQSTVETGWARDRNIRAEDVESTIYSALGIDWTTLKRDNRFGRGFEYVPGADQDHYGPINELWS